MVFVEGAIGIPAVALINWDDPYIHSSDDDLDKIDQTQLLRNNFLIGAMAFFLASADAGDVPILVAETYAQGARRLANDLQVAMRILVESRAEADRGWKRASIVMEQGVEREARALDSIRVFAGADPSAAQTVAEMKQVLVTAHTANGELGNFYRRLHGMPPPVVILTDAERAASRKVPANVASLSDYFARRGAVPNDARGRLHGLMRDEVYNFVDGRRSFYDIYKAVYAESQAAGTWYYGTVTLEDVVRLLEASVAAKALTLK
jgi:hypothetical protein